MHRDFQPVNARSQIIPAAAINIDDHVVGFRAEPAADVALADAVEADETPPAFHERVHQQLRVAVVAFRRKTRGVNDQCGFVLLRLPQVVARFEINETIRALGGIFGADPGEAAEQPVQLGVNDVEQMAASFRAGRVAPVVEQRQSLDGCGRPGGLLCRISDLPAGRAEFVERPLRQLVAQPFKHLHAVARDQFLVERGRRLFAGSGERSLVLGKITGLGAAGHGNRFAEFVGAGNPPFAGRILLQVENERPAVVIAAAARVPVAVRHGANSPVILRQALERGVDGLFFRSRSGPPGLRRRRTQTPEAGASRCR